MSDEIPKRKRGRPKKVEIDPKHIIENPHDPTATLKAMGYDPIVETIKTIKEVDQKIRAIKNKKFGRPSQAAIAALMSTKRSLNADLLRYGYRPIPEKVVQENRNFTFGIELTDEASGEIYEVERVIPEEPVKH